MGLKTSQATSLRPASLADALFTTTQQRVLQRLFGQPGRSFYASELIALTGSGSGAVQRELAKLEHSGLITTRRIGNQKHYQANAKSPLYAELSGIVQKTVGLAEPLRTALSPMSSKILAAFVYGSIAKGADTASSDIDLMVVSDSLDYAEIFPALEPLSAALGRTINPTIFSREALIARLKRGSAFARRVIEQPKIWIIGSEDALAA